MNLSEFTTKNVKAILFTVSLICLMGLAAYRTFPVSILPDVTFPRVVVIAEAGQRPTDMVEASITRPIEEAVATVPNVKKIRSRTKRGSTEISIDFDWGTDVVTAEQLVNAKVNEVRPELPTETKTETERMNPTVFPVLGLTLNSAHLSQAQLYDLAQYTIRPSLSRVEGVARVVVQGGREPEVEVVANPSLLASQKISLSDVVQAISQSNQVRAVGRLDRHSQQFNVLIDGQTTDLARLGQIVVAQHGGNPVLLRQVAKISNGVSDRTTVVSANGQECVLLNVIRQPSANSVAMTDAVKLELSSISKRLPADAKIGIFYDQSILVKDAIQSVGEAVLIGAALAVVVLLLFLHNLRATLVTAAIIPVTVLITFLLMRIAGLTLNLMTLGALAVGIGLVIDDAIVVVENVFKHLPGADSVASAVSLAAQEIARPMISSTLTTVVVFLPLMLLQGVAGAFFSALAITLTIALIVSLGLALFASPSLCAAFLNRESHRQAGPLFVRILRGYENSLRWGLKLRWSVPFVMAAILGATYLIGSRLGTGFMPNMDEGAFVLDYTSPAGASLDESDRLLRQVDAILLQTPEIAGFSRRTGTELGFSITESNRGDYAVMLKDQRHRPIDDVISDIRGQVGSTIPGLDVEFVQVLQDLIGDLAGDPSPIDIKLYGANKDVIEPLAESITKKLGDVKGLADLKSGVVDSGPELNLRVNESLAGRLGLTATSVAEQSEAAMLGTTATRLLRGDRQVGVRVRYPAEIRTNPTAIAEIPIEAPAGAVVPLGSLGKFETKPGTSELNREDQRRVIDVTAGLEGIDLGTAVSRVQKVLSETPLPAGVTVQMGGQFQSQKESFQNLVQVLGLAILLVFAVMLFQFRSFTAPTVILLVMPLALLGAVAALALTGTALNVSSFMGAIMLVGIVVKNGILLLDRAQEAEAAGVPLDEAVLEAGRQRLRPILMTSLTAILGLVPLALGIGAGAEMQKPLAITVIGGLTFSTVVTLVLAPILYYAFRKIQLSSRSARA